MVKLRNSDKLMSSVERLLIGLVRDATIGEVKNPDGLIVSEGPDFSEKLKLASAVTSFLATKAKIIADEPDSPSAFEGVLNELRGTDIGNANPGKKTRGRKRSEPAGDSLSAEAHATPLRDPLAPPGTDPYTINGYVYPGGNGADGSPSNPV
jgi:hypothetical protein